MFVQQKNKGIFAFAYVVIFILLIELIRMALVKFFGFDLDAKFNEMVKIGIACIFGGIASVLTDVLTINKGKVEIDMYQINLLYWISLRQWGYFLVGFGVLNIFFGIVES